MFSVGNRPYSRKKACLGGLEQYSYAAYSFLFFAGLRRDAAKVCANVYLTNTDHRHLGLPAGISKLVKNLHSAYTSARKQKAQSENWAKCLN